MQRFFMLADCHVERFYHAFNQELHVLCDLFTATDCTLNTG